MRNLFERTSSHWVRYSEYEWRATEDGTLYLTPAKHAKPEIYDPLKDAQQLVLDALNIGRLCMSKKPDSDIQKEVRAFALKYGLFGLMTALPTTPKFMEYENVYLPKNHFIKEETMRTEDYLALFFPFDKLDVIKRGVESLWNIQNDRAMMALAMTMSDKPMAVNMCFQREYAERYDWLKQQFTNWIFAFSTSMLYYEDYDKIDEDTRNLFRQSMAAFDGNAPTYHIALYDKPTIVWDFHSLLLGIQMMFSFMLTDDTKPLRMCKHCTKVFVASRPSNQFCSPECKNRYNVYKSRKKNKPDGEAQADGVMEAYIRIGNESVIAPDYVLNQLILRGMNRTYDALPTEYSFKDYAFSKLRERYRVWTGNSMEDKLFDSFEIRDEQGKLTNAGALIADDSPIRHSRLFCTRWNGLDKSGGVVDALDSAEYSGSLIILLNEGVSFVKRNMKTRWKKTADSRIEMPDYCERSVFEALVNALIHRDYLILGSEVHIDIYDDRLTIHSPGGMADGTRIQERDIENVSSTRRNPILADIFGRLGYMERQGSGFKKITDAYHAAHNFRVELEPKFYSDVTSFQVTLYNLNYGTNEKWTVEDEKVAFGQNKVAFEAKKAAFERSIFKIKINTPTKDKMLALFDCFEYERAFSRSDLIQMFGMAPSSAGKVISRLKELGLIKAVSGLGKGKYKFVNQQETDI